jgi:hypothetical protein
MLFSWTFVLASSNVMVIQYSCFVLASANRAVLIGRPTFWSLYGVVALVDQGVFIIRAGKNILAAWPVDTVVKTAESVLLPSPCEVAVIVTVSVA